MDISSDLYSPATCTIHSLRLPLPQKIESFDLNQDIRYSHISVTINPKAPYHSIYFGAPFSAPSSMKSKSTTKFICEPLFDEFFLDNLNNLTTDLSQKLEDINPIIEGANDMITTLNKVNFENTFNQIDILLTSMNGVFDDLESGEGGTLSLLLSDDSLYNNLNQTAYDLDKLLQHINENPKHFFAPLGKSRKKIERDLKKQKED